MQAKKDYLRQTQIVGWIALLQVVIVMFVIGLCRAAVEGDFSKFARDPGQFGLDIMIVVFTLYAAIPVLLQAFEFRAFRWFMVAVSIFFFLFFVAHQIGHMVMDKTALNINHVLDFAHHILMLWMIVCAIRWARDKT